MEKIEMGDTAYIYGAHNGTQYTEDESGPKEPVTKTHFDPRIHVTTYSPEMGLVQIGVVPPSVKDGVNVWDGDNDGQFLSLDRRGMARLIQELQSAAVSTFGRDPW